MSDLLDAYDEKVVTIHARKPYPTLERYLWKWGEVFDGPECYRLAAAYDRLWICPDGYEAAPVPESALLDDGNYPRLKDTKVTKLDWYRNRVTRINTLLFHIQHTEDYGNRTE